MYLNDLGEDNNRCYYCKGYAKKNGKYICNNPNSDYCTDNTEETFGCDAFIQRPITKGELRFAKKVKK